MAAQTYSNLEIVIVDDGSTDRTAKIAQGFCGSEPRARLLIKPNGGVASARNFGVEAATGEWIAPVDADDLWHPKKIEKQIRAALDAAETPGFVYCWYRQIDEADRVVGSGPELHLEGWAFHQLAYLNAVRNGSALLIAKAAIDTVGGYDESLRAQQAQGCEDVMIQLELARRYPVACVPEHLVGYRVGGERMSGDFNQIGRSWRLVYARIAAEEPSLKQPILRWVAAKSAFDDAQRRVVSGRSLSALPSVARALTLDPVRCGLLLIDWLIRAAAGRLRWRTTEAESRQLYDTDPMAPIPTDRYALAPFCDLIRSIETCRLKALRRDDTKRNHS